MPGGGGGSQTTTQITQPPAFQQPYIQNVMQQAQQQYNQAGPNYYPGQTIAAQSPETQAALAAQAARAANGSPVNAAAQGFTTNALNGGLLGDPNSQAFYQNTLANGGGLDLDAIGAAIRGQVMPGINASFSMAGRGGSPLNQQAVAQGLASGIAPYAFNAAQQNTQNQFNAAGALQQQNQFGQAGQMQLAGMAPGLANQDYADINAMGQVGAVRDQNAQAQINDAIARFNYYQQLPYNKLANYAGFVGQPVGSSTTQTQPYFSNGLAGALGGAASGAGLGGALGGALAGGAAGSVIPGWGTAIGAGVGLLGGLLA